MNNDPKIMKLSELSIEAEIKQPFDPVETLESCLVNLEFEIGEPHPLICRNGIKICSPGNLVAITSKSKIGKTFLAIDLAAGFIGNSALGFKGNPLPGKDIALIVDTEQALSYFYRHIRRINHLNNYLPNENHPKIKAISIKMLSEDEGFAVFQHAIEKYKPGLIILDGILDVAPPMNEERDCKLFIKKLYELATNFNTCIANILHENKQNRDMQGHLGHYLLKKCETVIQLSKDGDVIFVDNSAARDIPFETFYFRITDGMPELTEPLPKESARIIKMRQVLTTILPLPKSMVHKELVSVYTDFAGVSERTAKRHIADALLINILVKGDGDYYRLAFKNEIE